MTANSLLDTDLYKLTMQACVHKHFPDANVEYLLTNRSSHKSLNHEAVAWVQEQVNSWETLSLSAEELAYLRNELSYLPDEYFEFLETFKLNPREEVDIQYRGGGDLVVKVKGRWDTVMWYEVPVLSRISEAYFRFVETDWDTEGQYELAQQKSRELLAGACSFSEFGTRRRRSFEVQRLVVKAIADQCKGNAHFFGTSNVHFAREFGLRPIGTVAHELMMGIAAYTGDYANANRLSMETWIDTVGPEHAGVALTDTFGTQQFLRYFDKPYIDYYTGVRQDSGDPEEFTKLISEFYASRGIPPNTKRIVYSDALTVERCLHLRDVARKYDLLPTFGIGTYLTNDFHNKTGKKEKSVPLNIVIKISSVNGRPAVKLSDNMGKNTGDPDEVRRAKALLGYVEAKASIDEQRRWS